MMKMILNGFGLGLILLMVLTSLIFIFRVFFSTTSLFYLLKRLWRSVDERFHVYQFYKVPEHNNSFQENQLFNKVSTYISSLSSIEDSDYANLFSGRKSNEISVQLDPNQTVYDTFLSARISWRIIENGNNNNNCRRRTFVLKMKKNDKRRILRPYLQHIHSVADEIELRRKDVKLYTNGDGNGRWRSVPFAHPSNLDTVAMDSDLKSKVKSDLEQFLKAKQYYHRLGRVWKRSYLLHGPPGTGKSSFVAAMAKFLSYDVYDVDLSKITDDSDLKTLLLQTTTRSVIVIEDLDRFISEKSKSKPSSSSSSVSLSGILNFMDGIFSCCGEERVMVITMNSKEHIDPAILRPGRIDVQIYFPLCDFVAFKTLASSYLGLKDHKLFPQVEEIFQTGATLSQAEIGEIMIVNRSSPSRALKSVITALQSDGHHGGRTPTATGKVSSSAAALMAVKKEQQRIGGGGDESGEHSGLICRESVHTVREFRKLGGFLRFRSSGRRKPSNDFDVSSVEKDKDKGEGGGGGRLSC